MAVVILGMHRSGTSVTTRLTNLLGFAVCRPDDLVRGHGGNQRGHWESRTLAAENERLLSRVQSRWWCPPRSLAEVEQLAADAGETDRARQVFSRAYPAGPWVWKDPRTCLTLPFWLSTLDTKPAVILTLRDPAEVAASVHARDGLSVRFALAVWERYLRSAVEAAAGLPVLVTTFDEMTADPVRWCEQASEFLQYGGHEARMPGDPAGIGAFVHSGLRHQRRRSGPQLSSGQSDLRDALLGLVGPHACFQAVDVLPAEATVNGPLFEEARRAFGLVPGVPGMGEQARSFVSSSGIPLFQGPSPRSAAKPATPPKVSVVVLAGDGELPEFQLPGGTELILVRSEGPAPSDGDVRVVRRPGRLSRAARLNLGAEVASGDVLVFLDTRQVTPRAGWLGRLVGALGPEVGAVGPALLPAEGGGDAVIGLRFVDGLFNVDWMPAPAGAAPVAVPALTLRALATTRRRFDLAGGFDEGLDGVGGEDIDFCLRLWRAGYSCLAVPAAQVEIAFATEDADPLDRLRNTLWLGLVHLTGAALDAHLAALSAHPLFPAALASVTTRQVGRRRRVVEALASYDLASVRNVLDVDGVRPLTGPPQEKARDYRDVNRNAWDELSRLGVDSSRPWDLDTIQHPESWLDYFGWLPWEQINDVLVLAGGGGQQAALLARLGRKVTLVDISPEQLSRDRAVAERLGLDIEFVEADMCDLAALDGRQYDLVYQPVSTCYVPDVRRCYQQVAGMLRPGGRYWSAHWNPAQVQVTPGSAWDGTGYRVDRSIVDKSPRLLTGPGQANGPVCWHYVHSMTDLVGGICDAGFTIEKFAEYGEADLAAPPGSGPHLGAYFAPFYVLLARRTQGVVDD